MFKKMNLNGLKFDFKLNLDNLTVAIGLIIRAQVTILK